MKMRLRFPNIFFFLVCSIAAFSSCKDEQPDDDKIEPILCDMAEKEFTAKEFQGKFHPCRTDGIEREYSATASFKVVDDSTYMHLLVDDLDLDTTVGYTFWCEYYPLEPTEKTSLIFNESSMNAQSNYNTYYHSVWAWFQYEEGCEYGLFKSH